MDKMLMQNESAIDLNKMMHQAMTNYKKVIVVLSAGYKKKAEAFSSGVGNEYALLIKDIVEWPNKYILVSFEGISNDITPLALKGREIVDLSVQKNETRLFHKLLDEPLLYFSEVRQLKPVVIPRKVKPLFKDSKSPATISIETLISRPTTSMSQAGTYKYAVNEFRIEIKNATDKSIEGLNIEVKLPFILRPSMRLSLQEFGFIDNGNSLIKNLIENKKLFPSQKIITDKFEIEINSYNYSLAIKAEIIITVYTDLGAVTKSFKLIDYFKINDDYGQNKGLNSIKFG